MPTATTNDDETIVLRVLRDAGAAIAWSELRRKCALERTSMEAIARRLLERGLVAPTGEHDALVALTDLGRAHLAG